MLCAKFATNNFYLCESLLSQGFGPKGPKPEKVYIGVSAYETDLVICNRHKLVSSTAKISICAV